MKNHNSIFVDANVLLEVLLAGRKNAHIAASALSRASEISISALTYHLYVHFGKKDGHTIEALIADLADFKLIPIDEDIVKWAGLNYKSSDFEDALQVSCALRSQCDSFVTFDRELASKYKDTQHLGITLLKA